MISVIVVIAVIIAWNIAHASSHAPCKPGDCKKCPFPPCSDRERKMNTAQ